MTIAPIKASPIIGVEIRIRIEDSVTRPAMKPARLRLIAQARTGPSPANRSASKGLRRARWSSLQ